jgi:undecaprenyl-diphosphatase
MIEPEIHKERFVYNYETERQKKIWAFIILFISLIIFVITVIGFTDGFSEMTASFLESRLGFTNKWSSTYGPEWFVNLTEDVSALGGMIVLFIFLVIITGYFSIRKKQKKLWKFLFIVIGGGIFMLLFKIIFAKEIPYEPVNLLLTTFSTYPSGHTMMGTIFYLSLAVHISRRQHSKKTRAYSIVTACVIIVLIGIARVLHGSHSPTEVLAGWSIGMIWLCFCWFLEKYITKNRLEGF